MVGHIMEEGIASMVTDIGLVQLGKEKAKRVVRVVGESWLSSKIEICLWCWSGRGGCWLELFFYGWDKRRESVVVFFFFFLSLSFFIFFLFSLSFFLFHSKFSKSSPFFLNIFFFLNVFSLSLFFLKMFFSSFLFFLYTLFSFCFLILHFFSSPIFLFSLFLIIRPFFIRPNILLFLLYIPFIVFFSSYPITF